MIRSWIKSVEQLLVKENSVSWMHELDSIANVNLSDNQKKLLSVIIIVDFKVKTLFIY